MEETVLTVEDQVHLEVQVAVLETLELQTNLVELELLDKVMLAEMELFLVELDV